MDAAERIADYLSDDLAPDEREAFEAELARDAALRAQLDAARRADAALAEVSPTAFPDGFAERLRTALDAELAEVLAPPAAAGPDARVTAQAELAQRDDLAARRATRTVPRWVGGLAGAAAAALVVVAGIAGLSAVGGAEDEAAESASGEGFDTDAGGAADTMSAQEAEEAPVEEGEAETESTEESADAPEEAEADDGTSLLRAPNQPVLVAEGRSLGEDDLDGILVTPDLVDLASQRLPAAEGETLALEYRDRWQADTADEAGARTVGDPSDADREAVAACLASTDVDGRRGGIPAYAEIADFEGIPVVVLGLVSLDRDSDTWSVPEVQVLERSSCDLLAVRP